MGSISIDFIKKDDTTTTGHLYSDLHLDLQNDYKVRANWGKSSTELVDIKISYDIEAVKNSLTSIISTNPGERLLRPEFGLNIKRFLFSPATEHTAEIIGQLILDVIDRWEPRVTIREVTIIPLAEDQRYDVTLDFTVPSLKTGGSLFGSFLEGGGFVRG